MFFPRLSNTAINVSQIHRPVSMGFAYDELAQPNGEIRVAILEPGSFKDPIVVRFVRRELKVLASSRHTDFCSAHTTIG